MANLDKPVINSQIVLFLNCPQCSDLLKLPNSGFFSFIDLRTLNKCQHSHIFNVNSEELDQFVHFIYSFPISSLLMEYRKLVSNYNSVETEVYSLLYTELQIWWVVKDYSEIIYLNSLGKHIL